MRMRTKGCVADNCCFLEKRRFLSRRYEGEYTSVPGDFVQKSGHDGLYRGTIKYQEQ